MTVIHLGPWRKAGDGIHEIRCDWNSRALIIRTSIALRPGWYPIRKEVATFMDAKAFYESQYPDYVTDELVQEEIMWFWSDLEAESHAKKAVAS